MIPRFSNNSENSRFEYHLGGSFAYANYRLEGNELFIDKVEAPEDLRGTGAASALMQHIVDFARENKLSVVPVCSYAATWIQRRGKPSVPKL